MVKTMLYISSLRTITVNEFNYHLDNPQDTQEPVPMHDDDRVGLLFYKFSSVIEWMVTKVNPGSGVS